MDILNEADTFQTVLVESGFHLAHPTGFSEPKWREKKLLSQQVDSIAVSLFVNDLVEFDNNNNTVSDNKIQVSILALRRDALSTNEELF